MLYHLRRLYEIMKKQPHIQLSSDINVDSAIIVGDPARVNLISELMTSSQFLNFNREYKSVIGTYKNKNVLAISTGIGAPSTAIAIEELNNIGIKHIIRVGSAGAMQPNINLGDLMIAEGIVRDDGLTKKYVPSIYPALPSFHLLTLAHKYKPKATYGIVRSHDGFYMDDNEQVEDFWTSKGIIGADMESGILFILGQLRKLKTLSILTNVVLFKADITSGINNFVEKDEQIKKGEREAICLALAILSDHSLMEVPK